MKILIYLFSLDNDHLISQFHPKICMALSFFEKITMWVNDWLAIEREFRNHITVVTRMAWSQGQWSDSVDGIAEFLYLRVCSKYFSPSLVISWQIGKLVDDRFSMISICRNAAVETESRFCQWNDEWSFKEYYYRTKFRENFHSRSRSFRIRFGTRILL